MPAEMDEAVYADIFEVTPEPVMVHDPETGRILDVNRAACELVGRERDELVGAAVGDISTAGFTTEEAVEAIQQAAADGEHRVSWEIVGPAGQRRSVAVTLKAVTADGTPRVVAFVRESDVEAERERDQVQWDEQLRTMVNNLPVVVFALDSDGVFTHSAGKGLTALGLQQGELTGVSVFDAYADYPEIIDAVRATLDGEEVRVTQSVDDLVFETWYQPVVEDGEVVQVVGVARNITELKQREERVDALSEATNALLYTHTEPAVAERVTDIAERVIDRPIAAVWAYDEDADRLYPIGATETATEFAGVDIPKDLPEMGPETDEKAIFDAGEPAVIEDYADLDAPSAPGVPLGTLLCLPLDDHGLLCIGSTTVEPFDESERHLLDILSTTATAALDRVNRETELEAQRSQLAASNEALQRRRDQMEFFNSILRHDILNGMNVIRARADMLASELAGDEREYAETIVEWSDDIVDLTRKVRSVLQTLSDEKAAETKPVELAPVVESAARRATSMAPGASVDIAVPEDVAVTADDLLHDVFGNILTNAVEHGSTSPASQARQDAVEHGSTSNRNASRSEDAVEHGSTSPASQARQDAVEHGSTSNRNASRSEDAVEHGSTSPASQARQDAVEHGSKDGHGAGDDEPGVSVAVTATVDDATVTVRIADDGPGIAEPVRERVFERGGKSTDSSGTGFGLYFVDAMIESYGGRIWVEQSDTGGAAFVVELPKS